MDCTTIADKVNIVLDFFSIKMFNFGIENVILKNTE